MPAAPGPDPTRWTMLESEVHDWRRAHPTATWSEIQAELDRRLDVVRAAVLGELASEADEALGRWPACGGPLIARGSRQRTLVTDGEEPVTLTRP